MDQKTWTHQEVEKLYEMPLIDLVYQAQTVHREHFNSNEVQISTLLSIKTGTCPEDCEYCPQSGHYNTGLEKERLMDVEDVLTRARAAKEKGATRFCMGAAWRSPPKKEFPKVIAMIKGVKDLGLESCVTLGMLDEEQSQMLKDAGLDYYNHNLDTSPEMYEKIITTRSYQDRLDTLANLRKSDIKVCCGGIVGFKNETREDRIGLLLQLANLPQYPESVPINRLIPIKGTPQGDADKIDDLEFIKTIAVARIMMPKTVVRLSAGRETMSETMQCLCFMAGANSIFYGEKLLTAANPEEDQDAQMLERLGIKKQCRQEDACHAS
ncbi:MAG: biotin synthase BioB [Gammaproteobacteria bacterium]